MSAWFRIAFTGSTADAPIDSRRLAVDVDRDDRSHSALATFTVDGQVRGSMSLWLDGDMVDGFILRGAAYSLEVVVRDVSVLADEPALAELVELVCRSADLRLPTL